MNCTGSLINRAFILAAVCVVAGAAFGDNASKNYSSESELHGGFTFNSTRKDGTIEWKVEGSSATFLSPVLVEIKDVRAIYFAKDGSSMIATTEKAILNKETRKITTDEFVTIATDNSVTTGTGLDWDQEGKKGQLRKKVKVVYTHPEGKGLLK
jgi:LPS export ABC transporter protein LptC